MIADPAVLVPSLTWHPTRAQVLGVTLSDGSVQLCVCEGPQEASELWTQDAVIRTTTIHSHELEAWTLAFAPISAEAEAQGTKVLSGGDDIALQCSHINDTDTATATNEPTLLWRDRKLHDAGVTAILPLSESLIVTGSYDDYIRLLSIPTPTTGGHRQVLAELNLGGGVWRLKVLHAAGGAAGEVVAEGLDLATFYSALSASAAVPTRSRSVHPI